MRTRSAVVWSALAVLWAVAGTARAAEPAKADDQAAARELADVPIHVRSDNYGVIEDAHQAVMQLLAQYVRQSRMTPDAVATNTF